MIRGGHNPRRAARRVLMRPASFFRGPHTAPSEFYRYYLSFVIKLLLGCGNHKRDNDRSRPCSHVTRQRFFLGILRSLPFSFSVCEQPVISPLRDLVQLTPLAAPSHTVHGQPEKDQTHVCKEGKFKTVRFAKIVLFNKYIKISRERLIPTLGLHQSHQTTAAKKCDSKSPQGARRPAPTISRRSTSSRCSRHI
jgi:hypothetical protein